MRLLFKKIKEWSILIFRNRDQTPFLGHLIAKCPPIEFWKAGVEYLHTLVWSTMPFWLGAGLLYVQKSSVGQDVWTIFTGTFRNGELLVYTISTLTPITYFTLFEDREKRFPHRLGIGTIAIILIISCAALFSLQKAKVDTKPEMIYEWSLYFAAFAIMLRYIAVIYNRTKVPVTTELDLTQPVTDFVNELDVVLDQNAATNASDFDQGFGAALDAQASRMTQDQEGNTQARRAQ
jgi:hypothetical protein